jgi:hypothetical protein
VRRGARRAGENIPTNRGGLGARGRDWRRGRCGYEGIRACGHVDGHILEHDAVDSLT